MPPPTLSELRQFAIDRSLFPPTTLKRAMARMGFVQADPIRAPARAQDLVLRHRVAGYRAGDLERRYASLDIDEGVFINYGFMAADRYALMHPRNVTSSWSNLRRTRAEALHGFVRDRGSVHPRLASEHFAHGSVTNYWGGTSNATTHLLDEMHYAGSLRIIRREGGIRIYAAHDHGSDPVSGAERQRRLDALVDLAVGVYAPLPASTLSYVVARLRWAVPQWRRFLRAALLRAKARLSSARVDGGDWYWPAGERPRRSQPKTVVRLLAPFDPVVWDRRRFQRFWGWPYQFEAYKPAAKRTFGYYALPLLWLDRIVGWGNLSVTKGRLQASIGYVDGQPPSEAGFATALEAEIERMRVFLRLETTD